MTGPRDATLLVERAEAVDVTRPQRVDEVFGRIRTHRRRRATAAIAGSSGVVLALVLGLLLLNGNPVKKSDDSVVVNPPAPVRKVTYTDEYWPTTTIHYGDRTIDIREQLAFGDPGRGGIEGVVHMDVTDDRVVFTTEGGASGSPTGRARASSVNWAATSASGAARP